MIMLPVLFLLESKSMHFDETAEKKRSNIGVGAGMFVAGLKNMVDTAKQTFDASVRTQKYVGTVLKCVHCGAVISKTNIMPPVPTID